MTSMTRFRKPKNITLINVNPPYGMEASTLKLATQSRHPTSNVWQVLVCEKQLLVKNLTEVEERDKYKEMENVDNDEDDDNDEKVNEPNKIPEQAEKVEDQSEQGDDEKDGAKDKAASDKKEAKKDDQSNDETKVSKDDKNDNDKEETKTDEDKKPSDFKPLAFDELKDLLQSSHTVVLPDALFSEHSRVFHTDLFLKHGLDSLVDDVYKSNAGTVIVLCMEGLFAIDKVLNERFGCDWKIQFMEVGTCLVEPTEAGSQLLGPFAPKTPLLKDNPHFVSCNSNKTEGLYQSSLQTKDEFVVTFRSQDEQFEKLGIEPDLSMDCFNVETSWKKYLERYTDRYCVAVHRDDGASGNGGTVVYYGDRGQSDTMAYVFCKLLNLEPTARRQQAQQQATKQQRYATTGAPTRVPWSLVFSGAVVVAAVVFQWYENQQQQ